MKTLNSILPCIFLLVLTGCKEKKIEKNAEKMQQFVTDISSYARSMNPDFIIIPQNGIELAFKNTNPDKGVMSSYLSSINGIGVEELFYHGSLSVDNERLSMLKKLVSSKKIIIADYVSDNSNIANAIERSKNEGFISFPRRSDNYDYKFIPQSITDENGEDITRLNDAKNCLYLISTDNFADKQSMISAIGATNYDVVLIDLFFDESAFTKQEVQQLKEKANGAKRLLIAYISIGSAENYRYYWQSDWKQGKPSWLKKKYQGYQDEIWVQFWHKEWQNIIYGNDNSYIKKIIDAGFDGSYLDNVEAYYFLSDKD